MKFTVNLDADGAVERVHDGNPKNECNSEKGSMKDAETWGLEQLLYRVGTMFNPLAEREDYAALLCQHCLSEETE